MRRLVIAAGLLAGALSLPPFVAQLARGGHLPTAVVQVLERIGVLEEPTYAVGILPAPRRPTPPPSPQ
jgi:hypothetical protein